MSDLWIAVLCVVGIAVGLGARAAFGPPASLARVAGLALGGGLTVALLSLIASKTWSSGQGELIGRGWPAAFVRGAASTSHPFGEAAHIVWPAALVTVVFWACLSYGAVSLARGLGGS